ncbi:hypothetical protein C7271_04835 [filamentous cyanobacterium CCP5]|nr:hypothetical protein C7271_04835 [filamentous cyanobacterium CCP5]
MKLTWAPVCSISLAAGILGYSLPGQGQGICYFVNADGQTINLDSLCQSRNSSPSGSISADSASDVDSPPGAAPSMPQVTRTTITIPGTSSGTDLNRSNQTDTPMAEPSNPASESTTSNPTTFISGPGQPLGNGAVMTNSDPRIILPGVIPQPAAEPDTAPSEPNAQ